MDNIQEYVYALFIRLFRRVQTVVAVRLVTIITPVLRQLYWQTEFKLAVMVFITLHGCAPPNLFGR